VELIDQIEALCPALPKSVPKAAQDGKIWHVLNKVKGLDTGAAAKSSTFVRRMDCLFGSTARDAEGRMTQIQRDSSGIALVVQYWRKIYWKSDGIPLAIATLKLTQVLGKMQRLWCVTGLSLTDDILLLFSSTEDPKDQEPKDALSPPASSTGSKRNASQALSDSEDISPPKKIRAST
jgi:hypothetical protein